MLHPGRCPVACPVACSPKAQQHPIPGFLASLLLPAEPALSLLLLLLCLQWESGSVFMQATYSEVVPQVSRRDSSSLAGS